MHNPSKWLVSLHLAACLAVQTADAFTPTNAPVRLLCLLADGFNRDEFYRSAPPLRVLGFRVDVATPAGAPAHLSVEGAPDAQGRDVRADLSLDAVDPSAYAGLLIPGGYSPGNLEKHPRALELCRAFMDADKPVAAICHGARLLMRADRLRDRVATCLFSVPNELADDWRAGALGAYVDQAVVRDRHLLTSRYPGDVEAFTRAFAALLAETKGLAPGHTSHPVAVIGVAALDKHTRWLLQDAPAVAGLSAILFDDAAAFKTVCATGAAAWAGAVVLSDVGSDWTDWCVRTGLVFHAPGPDINARLAAIGAMALSGCPAIKVSTPIEPLQAAIALREGFDLEVVSACEYEFRRRGWRMGYVAPARGWVRALNGGARAADWTYATPPPLTADAVILAPGGLWPERAVARQAVQPEWVIASASLDEDRVAWLVQGHAAGHRLVTVGFDSLRVGRHPAFKGCRFAASPQTVWSFGKTGGVYAREGAVEGGSRLISAASAADLPLALGWLP